MVLSGVAEGDSLRSLVDGSENERWDGVIWAKCKAWRLVQGSRSMAGLTNFGEDGNERKKTIKERPSTEK